MKGHKIHIIDDDPETYEILNVYLELAGFTVAAAFDGRAGLDMMLQSPPSLVLLDIQMPQMDGFQLLEAMRRYEPLKNIPVLFITSLDRTNLKIKGLELGADDFIVKPFERAELFARIKSALRRSERYRQTENMLSGNLGDISLIELLQTMEIGKKTALLQFTEMDGAIYIEDGLIRQIIQGDYAGEDAFTRLLFLNRGSFVVDFGQVLDAEVGEHISIQHQLLNSLVCIDKVEQALAQLPDKNPEVSKTPPGFEAVDKMIPCPLQELLVAMPGDLAANAELFVKHL